MSHVHSLGNALKRVLIVVSVVLSLLATGCMKIPGLDQMKPEYYPQCYQPFVDLEKAQNDLIKRTAISAGVGAISGAAIGFLTTGDLKGALIGGGVGLFAGTALGYGTGKMQQIKDDKERMRSYQADMNADMLHASRVEQYTLASLQCYTREFDSLLAQYRAGLLSKEEVEVRYKEIREGMTIISNVLTNSKDELIKRDGEYRSAFEAEAKAKNKTAPEVISLDDHRQQLEKQAQLEQKKQAQQKKLAQRKSQKARKRKSVPAQPEPSELNKVSNELAIRKEQAEQRTSTIEKLEKASAEQKNAKDAPSNVEDVSKYYEKQYLDSVVRLEEAKNMNERTLAAMSEAAKNAGIDMV